MTFFSKLQKAKEQGLFSDKHIQTVIDFYNNYQTIAKNESISEEFLTAVLDQIEKPYKFEPYHKAIREPFDYYTFGLKFARPLIESIDVQGLKNLEEIQKNLEKNENAVLFGNHQTELDPQLFSIALEENFPTIAKEVIFVAGDRVTTDPFAIPFSMGRNLLCIYSKRHIANPPEKRHEKQLHNQKTMKVMRDLLSKGGKCIYVAPSGGRDRKDEKGEVVVSEFDPNNIEMFRLMTHHASQKTHFYPLSLVTHDLLPPPDRIQRELGERRNFGKNKILFYFGQELDLEHFPGCETSDRILKRKALSDFIWNLVNQHYLELLKRK